MRPRDGAKIGAAGRDDGVGVIGLGDRADGDGGDLALVADLVGERRLEQPAVDRPLLLHDLPRRTIDEIGARVAEQAREDQRVLRHVAALEPVVAGEPHRDRPVLRPGVAHRAEHFERIARAVCVVSAVLVVAPVGERGQETRQQIAVRAMQFEPIDAGLRRAARRGDEIVAHAVHIVSRHRPRDRAVLR